MLRLSIGSCMLRMRLSIGSCMLRLRLRLSIASCMLRLSLSFRGSGEAASSEAEPELEHA